MGICFPFFFWLVIKALLKKIHCVRDSEQNVLETVTNTSRRGNYRLQEIKNGKTFCKTPNPRTTQTRGILQASTVRGKKYNKLTYVWKNSRN